MSRLGKKPVQFDSSKVKVEILSTKNTWGGDSVRVQGPNGEFTVDLRPQVTPVVENDNVRLEGTKGYPQREVSMYSGLYRSLLEQKIIGVVTKFTKSLEIVGIGYKVEQQGQKLKFSLGFSHDINFELPAGVEAKITDKEKIDLSSADKELLGETAAKIRNLKKPEPYKGKGIKYANEVIKRKAGKTAS